MSSRSDLLTDWNQSPRIITVLSPSVELTVQDNHDTARVAEHEPANSSYSQLVKSAGKEDLGGGTLVGITSTMQDAVIAFEARKTSVSGATITTGDTTGFTITDTGATFIADGVDPGAWVVNITDQSVCSVSRVVSETELLTDGLGDGTDDQFDVSDVVKIWNVIQVEVSGGNLVAVDDVGAAMSSILPTMGTQVLLARASTATLQELEDIQHSSFNGRVTVDLINGVSGISFPIGTERQPSGNLTDSLAIAATRGITTIRFIGDATIPTGHDLTDFTIQGGSQTETTITVDVGAMVTGTEWESCTLQGDVGSGSLIVGSVVMDIDGFDGFCQRSLIKGTIVLSGTGQASVLDCWGCIPDVGIPTVDMGGTGSDLTLSGYSGRIQIENLTGATDQVFIELASGHVTLDSTITAGIITIRGVGTYVDNSTGTTLDTTGLVSPASVTTAVWDADRVTSAGTVKEALVELFELAGLDPTKPLVVEKTAGVPTARKVPGTGADIDQTIVDTSTETTVTRV